jgi:hypothetical protein
MRALMCVQVKGEEEEMMNRVKKMGVGRMGCGVWGVGYGGGRERERERERE